MRNQVSKKASAIWLANQNDSNPKLYAIGRAFMTKHLSNNSNNTSVWYLNSYASRHICNNWDLFLNLQYKNYKFIIIGGEIIQSWEVNIICILLQKRKNQSTQYYIYLKLWLQPHMNGTNLINQKSHTTTNPISWYWSKRVVQLK